MYKSKMTASALIDEVVGSVDVSAPPTREFYLRTLTRLEQLLYSDYIHEERLAYPVVDGGELSLADIPVPQGERTPVPEDVFSLICDDFELIPSTIYGIYILPPNNTQGYYCREDDATLSVFVPAGTSGDVALFYYARPLDKVTSNQDAAFVALPDEFIPHAASYLRGEAYKVCDDDTMSAKWLAEYNNQLAAFCEWTTAHRFGFGGKER